jgi:hypothetical protein
MDAKLDVSKAPANWKRGQIDSPLDPANWGASRMKRGVVAWLEAITIVSMVLSVGCWFTAAGSNPDLGASLLVLTEVGLIVFLRSGILLIIAKWRTWSSHLDTATLAPREAAMAAFAKGWRREWVVLDREQESGGSGSEARSRRGLGRLSIR